jgi:hypothetical protein
MPLKLLCFRAHRCAECERQQQAWDQVKREALPQVEVREVELDGQPEAARFYRVREHPCTVLVKEGHEVRRWTGVVGADVILQALAMHAESAPRTRTVPVAPGAPITGGRLPGAVATPPEDPYVPPPGTEPMPSPGEPPLPPGG